jgi:hypothetical protein
MFIPVIEKIGAFDSMLILGRIFEKFSGFSLESEKISLFMKDENEKDEFKLFRESWEDKFLDNSVCRLNVFGIGSCSHFSTSKMLLNNTYTTFNQF